MYLGNNGTPPVLKLTNSQFRNNSAAYCHGVIYIDTGATDVSTIPGCTFERNTSLGAVEVANAAADILNCTFTGNSATRGHNNGGGAIHWDSDKAGNILGNTFTGNTTDFRGGALYIDGGSPLVEFNTFSGNMAYDNLNGCGGAIYAYVSGTPIIRHNLLCHNSSDGYGGGLHVGSGSSLVENNTFSDNSSVEGGNVYLADTSTSMRNCIVAFARRGGGVSFGSGLPTVFAYNDVYGNNEGDYRGVSDQTGSNGNLMVDPLFANAGSDDYRLKSIRGRWDGHAWVVDAVHSRCIDAGDPASPRALEPAPNGHRINLGFDGNTKYASKGDLATPDMLVKLPPEARWAGNNTYNTTGAGQSRASTVGRGVTAIYDLRVQNDAFQMDDGNFVITGPPGNAQWQVAYYDALTGGTPITTAVTGTGWAPPVLATSSHDPTKQDAVLATTTVASTSGSSAQVCAATAVPTKAGAQVTFTLTAAARVEARVLNIAGRPVRTLCHARQCEAGTNALVWDAQSDTGLRAPAGTYLIEVVARAADGAQARALVTVRLAR